MAVHNFIHLNLAIALLAGYIVFAVGVELGTRNKVLSAIGPINVQNKGFTLLDWVQVGHGHDSVLLPGCILVDVV